MIELLPLPQIQPFGVEIHTADGVFIKQIHIPFAETIVPQHSHQYSHHSMLARGSVLFWSEDKEPVKYCAPTAIYIEARIKHTFMSLEPDTIFYCIHNLHGKEDVEIAEHHEIGD